MSLENFKNRKIEWDTVNKNFDQSVQIVSGDVNSRTLTIVITDNGEPINLTGYSVKLIYKYVYNDISGFVMLTPTDAPNGEFSLTIPTEMTSPGSIKSNLILLNENLEQVIVSKNLKFISDDSTVTDLAQEVNSKIDDFTKLLLSNMPQVMRSELDGLHAQTESNTSNIELKANSSDMTSLQSAMNSLQNKVEAFGITPENLVTIKSLLDAIANNATDSEVAELINSVNILTSNISLMSDGDYSPKANKTDLESLQSAVNNQSATISTKANQTDLDNLKTSVTSQGIAISAMPTQDDYNILETSIAMNKISYMYDGNFIINFDTNYLTWDSSAVINYGENLYYNINSGSIWLSGNILLAFDTHTNEILTLSGYHEMTEGRVMLAFIITSDISKSMNFAIGKLSAVKNGIEMTFDDLKYLEETVPYKRIKGSSALTRKKYMCFGDSITSDQVSGVGTLIANDLQLDLQANFAVGWSTMQDWQDGGANVTVETLTHQQNEMVNTNVLSNQVLRAIQSTTSNGQQLTWIHPVDGIFSIDTSVGVGTGTLIVPDVIYIASSTNDGENINTPIVDNTDTVLAQNYSQLDKISIASALRWTIETFQSAYPNAQIFVASPIQTNCGNSWMSFSNNKIKRDIIAKVCQFTSVNFIDSFNASGFSKLSATSGILTADGIHPNATGKNRLVSYVGSKMKHKYLDI